MRNEHTVNTYISTNLSNPVGGWHNPTNKRIFGDNVPLLVLQENDKGQGRVIFNHQALDIPFNEFKRIFGDLKKYEKHRHYDDRFISETVYFKDRPDSKHKDMYFSDFLNKKTFSQENIWMHNTAMFTTIDKAEAFMEFLEKNIPKATACFYDELGDLAKKISDVIPVKVRTEMVSRERFLEKLSAKENQYGIGVQPSVKNTGPKL